VASVKVNLLDEVEELIDTLYVEHDETYDLNDHFKSPDGGLYLICEVKAGEPPVDVELSGIWIDGPHPTSRLREHS
jgi:hypothetical protein